MTQAHILCQVMGLYKSNSFRDGNSYATLQDRAMRH